MAVTTGGGVTDRQVDFADLPLAALPAAGDPGSAGYELAGTDGGIFAFGDARFDGSMGGRPLEGPVVTVMAP